LTYSFPFQRLKHAISRSTYFGVAIGAGLQKRSINANASLAAMNSAAMDAFPYPAFESIELEIALI
jgi:hypothetical protein